MHVCNSSTVLSVLTILQGDKVKHGPGYYIKPVAHPGPDYATSQRIFKTLTDLHSKDIEIVTHFEYLSPNKLMEVPNGTMAFNRTDKMTAVTVLIWDNAIKDRSQEASNIAREMSASILGDAARLDDPSSFGYGNYGKDLAVRVVQLLLNNPCRRGSLGSHKWEGYSEQSRSSLRRKLC